MSGWKGSVAGVQDMDDLPLEAQMYVNRIEELIQCKVILVSTSPERSDTILLENPFQYK
jgi:adenylosuccinate synthase